MAIQLCPWIILGSSLCSNIKKNVVGFGFYKNTNIKFGTTFWQLLQWHVVYWIEKVTTNNFPVLVIWGAADFLFDSW